MMRSFGGKNSCRGLGVWCRLPNHVFSSTEYIHSNVDEKYMQLRKKAHVSNYVYVTMLYKSGTGIRLAAEAANCLKHNGPLIQGRHIKTETCSVSFGAFGVKF
ncbi:hypothetical protein LguiB_011349 [Lonicera macranthoides]